MSENQKQVLTQKGYDKLVKEIEERETITRKNIADDIEKARQQGDLSENAAYKAALEAKEFNEVRIVTLKDSLSNSEIISHKDNGTVGIGSHVKLERKTDKMKINYNIVGHNEADPLQGKITLDSPVGSALEGSKIGDTVSVKTPSGDIEYIIISVE